MAKREGIDSPTVSEEEEDQDYDEGAEEFVAKKKQPKKAANKGKEPAAKVSASTRL